MPPLARELPGFYYDEEKNRYFPLNSHPTNSTNTLNSAVQAGKASSFEVSRKRRRHGQQARNGTLLVESDVKKPRGETLANLSSTALLRRAAFNPSSGTRALLHREYLSRQLVTSDTCSNSQNIITSSNITSYSIDAVDPRSQVIGTEDGSYWLGWHNKTMNKASHALRDGSTHDQSMGYLRLTHQWRWTDRLYGGAGIDSKISRINSTNLKNGKLLVTSSGSPAHVSLSNIQPGSSGDIVSGQVSLTSAPQSLNHHTEIPKPLLTSVSYSANRTFDGDVWSSTLTRCGLALGMSKRVLILENYEYFLRPRTLDGPLRTYATSTDMLSVAHSEDQIFAGGRNGIVLQYDTRTPDQKGLELLRARSSVTNITPLRSWELMVTAINGDIDMHDLRALRSSVGGHGIKSISSLLQLHGHKSSLSLKTPLALYPTQDFAFIGGEDGYIRAWNTRTGDLLGPKSPSLSGDSSIFATHYNHPIAGMHFSDTRSEPWPSLWVASGTTVEQWELGRHLMQSA